MRSGLSRSAPLFKLLWIAAAFSLTAMNGCGENSGGGVELSAHQSWDSAGVVVTVTPLWTHDAQVIHLEEADGSLVASEDGQPLRFLAIDDVRRWGEDHIAVLESNTGKVRRISLADGSIDSFGALGDGPGEFRRPTRLVPIAHDSLGIWDSSNRRITIPGPAAQGYREVSLHPDRLPQGLPTGGVVPVAGLPDGSLLTRASRTPDEEGLVVQEVAFFRLEGDERRSEEVFTTVGDELWTEMRIDEGRAARMTYPLPFGRRLNLTVSDGGTFILAGPGHDELQVRGTDDGELVRIHRFPSPGETVSDESIERDAEALGRAGVDEATKAAIVDRAHDVSVGRERPLFGDVVAGSDGRIWLGDYVNTPGFSHRWLLMERDGAITMEVKLPEAAQLVHAWDDQVLLAESTPEGDYMLRLVDVSPWM